MARPSSMTTVVRTLVMLGFLITVPAMAISGRSVPETIKNLFEQKWPATAANELPEQVIWNVTPTSCTATEGGPKFCGTGFQPVKKHGQDGRATLRDDARQVAAAPGVTSSDLPPDVAAPLQENARRLNQLGAKYYLLESWGHRGQLYRFSCRVAVSGSESLTRYFEATADEPLGAMGEVLAEIEAWQTGR